MSQMLALFEWDESLGSRWMNQDNLETLLYSPDQTTENEVTIVAVHHGDATEKERAIYEAQSLSARCDALRAYIATKPPLGAGDMYLLHVQLQHMSAYHDTIIQRLKSWTDETP